MRLVLALLLLLALTVGIAAYGIVTTSISGAGPLPEAKLVLIAPGSSGAKAANVLAAEGAIASPLFFRLAVRLKEAGGSLKAGEYLIPARASVAEIVDLLQSGRSHPREFTAAEGLTSLEIVEALNKAEAMTGTIEDIPAEGSLLPETYHYIYGDPREKILSRMQKGMEEALAGLWETRVEGLPLKTKEEALTLASVVEKETGVGSERAKVAGVFVNRLKTGMPLQSDPTVIYAITEGKRKLDRQLYRKDLNIASPYNTYYTAGLPPGPIANPGRAALEAVMRPETHDLYYFVADGTGGHAFGRTMEDHLRNVTRWREIQRGE